MKWKTILSLCDFTGEWPKPYKEAGYNVIQVDIQHGQDVRLLTLPDEPIHGILAAPPCTEFAVSGATWWEQKGEAALLEGLSIVDACLRIITITNPKWWVLENPVGRLKHYLGKPAYYFQPNDYGDPYTKRTCLWGNFTPPDPLWIGGDWSVQPIKVRNSGHHSIDEYHIQNGKKLGGFEQRKMIRSITPPGFAKAFFLANP